MAEEKTLANREEERILPSCVANFALCVNSCLRSPFLSPPPLQGEERWQSENEVVSRAARIEAILCEDCYSVIARTVLWTTP